MIQHILQLVISVIQIFRQQGKITDSPQLALHKIFFQSITFFIEHIIWYYDEVVNDCKAFVFVHSQDECVGKSRVEGTYPNLFYSDKLLTEFVKDKGMTDIVIATITEDLFEEYRLKCPRKVGR